MLPTFISAPPSAVSGSLRALGEPSRRGDSRSVRARGFRRHRQPRRLRGDCRRHLRYGAASYADYLTFFDGLSRLDAEGIPVYMCTGNHDPYTTWQRDLFNLPGNVTMFSADKPSFALYRRDGKPVCVLGGRGYYNQTWPWGCLHRRGRYASCCKRGPRGGRGHRLPSASG